MNLIFVCKRRNSEKSETITELAHLIKDVFNGLDPEDCLFDIGLEPDYVDDLIDLVALTEEHYEANGLEDMDDITVTQIEEYVEHYMDAHC